MQITIGRGNNRQSLEIATGRQMKAMAKTNPIEHVKIVGNLKALVRNQPKVHVSPSVLRRMKAK